MILISYSIMLLYIQNYRIIKIFVKFIFLIIFILTIINELFVYFYFKYIIIRLIFERHASLKQYSKTLRKFHERVKFINIFIFAFCFVYIIGLIFFFDNEIECQRHINLIFYDISFRL